MHAPRMTDNVNRDAEHPMDEPVYQRQYIRYPLGIEARAVVGSNVKISRCSVTTISHGGAAMHLQLQKALAPGQNIMLEIRVPEHRAPINFIVKIKWFEFITGDDSFNAAAGGVITQIKDEDRNNLLDYAYNQLLMVEK